MTYEPYLSAVREKPEAGKIIATTLDYPMVMDTFGCTPKFLAENPKAAKALADSYFDALELIKKDPKKSFEIMGADVKQSGEAFEASQKYLRWQDREANARFFAGEHAAGGGERALGAGVNQVGDGLGLSEINSAVEKGALGELARLGEARAGFEHGVEHGLADRGIRGDPRPVGRSTVAGVAHAREMKSPVRVSTLIFVPVSRKSGTAISAPVSRVAGLVPPVERSPCRPGSV